MSFHKSVMGRGVLSDNAKKLSDVIDRVVQAEKTTEQSYVATCPCCYEVIHLTLERGLPSGWKPR
jgi:hypothetical protein